MGGAYIGDDYENSFYLNPGQNNHNHWINLCLQGTISNRAAIGARIKLTFKENDSVRSVYRDVNSGGSFGSNPLCQHIGVGQAAVIEKMEIFWPVTGKTQLFEKVPVDVNLKITEGENKFISYNLARFDLTKKGPGLIKCSPK
jgi:hypothetical protein